MKKDYLKLISSAIIFGSIGVFRNLIPFPSSIISFARGTIGTLFLFLLIKFQASPMDITGIKKNIKVLAFSGIFIGINWVFLFEAYRFTTISAATMALYMQPTFVILASPFILKEPLSFKKFLIALVAVSGMVLVSGVLKTGLVGMKGVFFALIAAVLYASVIILNQFLEDISAYEKTIVQLLFATIIVFPYILITEDIGALEFNSYILIMLLIVGVLHTGIAYALYFGAMENLPAQTVALLSYIDPVVAVILSGIILKESLTLPVIIGSIMVLGSAYFGEKVD